MTEPPVIRTRGLRKRYGTHEALAGLDLEVAPGRVVGFLGPNGAGKTTTLKILLGLTAPSDGTAELFGRDVRERSFELRRRVGFLAQEPRFYPYLTARETLALVARLYGLGSATEERGRIDATLERVGIAALADRRVGGFSGGERQRLGLAQAALHDPDLLILDEPAASLDPMGRRDVLTILKRLEGRATVFFSTHILDDVQRIADEVAIVDRGRLRSQGRLSEMLQGDGTTVTMELRGDATALRDRVRAAPWTAALEAEHDDGIERWTVRLERSQAGRDLLRLAAQDDTAEVLAYRVSAASLEDVFVQVIEGQDRHDAA
jgi:ABC-2 type transport system ATP-binding protein